MSSLKRYRFLILRRVVQLGVLLLFFGANAYGWKVLVGNLSASKLFDVIPLADPYAVLQMLCAGAAISSDLVLGAVIVTLFYAIIGGRAFCSWVCPVNLITDLAGWLRRKLKIDVEGKRVYVSRRFRYWFAASMLVLSVITGVAAFEFISPIGVLTRGIVFSIGFGWTLILAIFLFDLFVLKNGWCGHICPLGGVYSLIGAFNLVRVRHTKDRCTLCGECFTVCPEREVLDGLINKKDGYVKGIACTNCGRCVEVCEDGALRFDVRKNIRS